MTPRTMPMIRSEWPNRSVKNPCAVCGRELRGKIFAVHIIDGGGTVLHPDDEDKYLSDSGDMGAHFVGPECRKKFGEFAITWDES